MGRVIVKNNNFRAKFFLIFFDLGLAIFRGSAILFSASGGRPAQLKKKMNMNNEARIEIEESNINRTDEVHVCCHFCGAEEVISHEEAAEWVDGPHTYECQECF